MATINVTAGYTFTSGETVEANDLNLLGQPTAALAAGSIVNADINASAGIALSKLATGTLPASVTVADATLTAAKLNGAQTGSAPAFACRAFVHFDGTRDTANTVTTAGNRLIRSSGNVSSVSRSAAGEYTVTFTTPMASTNYVAVGSAAGTASLVCTTSNNTNTLVLTTRNSTTAAATDLTNIQVAIFA
jgi:hypothetical protein